MDFREIKNEIGEVFQHPDSLRDVAQASLRIAGVSSFAAVGNMVNDMQESGKLTPVTKLSLAVAVGATVVTAVATAKALEL